MPDLSGYIQQAELNASYTYGYCVGSGTGTYVAGDRDDWYARRSANDNSTPTDVLNTDAHILEYFDGDDAAFDDTPVWVYVPINQAGWASFACTVRNRLGVSMRLDVYAVPVLGPVSAVGGPVANLSAFHTIVSALDVPAATSVSLGPGGSSINSVSMWPIGYLCIKMTPASDPGASTYWSLHVSRSR